MQSGQLLLQAADLMQVLVRAFVDEPDVGRQSPTVLASLCWWLSQNRVDPTALYERALLDHPRDFWLHLHAAMQSKDPRGAVGLAHAAVALRPRNVLAYNSLSFHLRRRGDWAAAVIVATSPPNADLLPRGLLKRSGKQAARQILDPERLERVWATVAGDYSLILVAAGCIDDPTALSVAASCSATLLLVSLGETPRLAALEAREHLLAVGANPAGCLICD